MPRQHLWFFDGRKSRHSRACPCRNQYFVIQEKRPSTKTEDAAVMRLHVDAIRWATRSVKGQDVLREIIRAKRAELRRRAGG
jgi:hypothetical protein